MLVTANIFQPLIDVFEAVLKFFHNTIGVGWGLSIVLLTVVMRAVLVPLAIKQYHSMQKLQRLQPKIKEIQKKYKDDKQRQQQEMMKFYKEAEVNPLGSCLPLLPQIPAFIALFYMLQKDLRPNICHGVQVAHHVTPGHTVPCGPGGGAGFLFVSDLTNNATGVVLIVLIVLYVGTQLASSLILTPPTVDPTQRRIMLLLPLFFVIFIVRFPAGVIVYWITTNVWTLAQQYTIRELLGHQHPPLAAEEGGAAKGGGRGGPRADGPQAPAEADGASGLRERLLGRPKEEPVSVAAGRSKGPPPPPPRKKKKRSGRRR